MKADDDCPACNGWGRVCCGKPLFTLEGDEYCCLDAVPCDCTEPPDEEEP